MTASSFHYAAYGLAIQSGIALPFRPAGPTPSPDLTIRVGRLPRDLPVPTGGRAWSASPGVLRLDVDGVARYLVRNGREIVVEPAGGSPADLDTFLLGSVFGACLQQRGIVPLHAGAIETEAGAVVFAGGSGTGKSTLVAGLVDRGFLMLAEDVTGIVLDSCGRPVALEAFPAIRLWADAVDALAWNERARGPVRDGVEKYVVPVEAFRPGSLSVRAVFILANHNRSAIEVEPVPRGAAVRQLFHHIYRRRFLHAMGRGRDPFRVLAALAKHRPVAWLGRPSDSCPPAALADEVERRLRTKA